MIIMGRKVIQKWSIIASVLSLILILYVLGCDMPNRRINAKTVEDCQENRQRCNSQCAKEYSWRDAGSKTCSDSCYDIYQQCVDVISSHESIGK